MKKHWTKSLKFKRFIQFRSFIDRLVKAAESKQPKEQCECSAASNETVSDHSDGIQQQSVVSLAAVDVKVIDNLASSIHSTEKPVLHVTRADGSKVDTDIDIARKHS